MYIFKFLYFIAIFSSSIYADNCADSFKSLLRTYEQNQQALAPDSFIDSKKFITEFLKVNGIPSFLKKNAAGVEVPYILVNKKTVPKLKSLLEVSYGTQIVLQHDYNNDHGLMRIGQNIIDVDAPGHRGFGEIEKTGLAWKDAHTYVDRRGVNSYKIVEVSYVLSPEEKKVIEYYQRIRRSAIFRVKFSFGGIQANPHPFMLENGGEHCFIFCKAGALSSQLSELKSKVISSGIANPDIFLEKESVKILMDKFRDFVIAKDDTLLSSLIIKESGLLDKISNELPNDLASESEKITLLRWLIGYDSSKKYSKTLNTLGVTSDFGVADSRNTRASAVLVYDPAVTDEVFKSGEYETNGKSFRWQNTAQRGIE